MVNFVALIALGTAGIRLRELIVGRPLPRPPDWPQSQRATRWGGAYTLAVSLLVAALAISYPTGVAFMTYGILVLAFAATVQLTKRRRSRT